MLECGSQTPRASNTPKAHEVKTKAVEGENAGILTQIKGMALSQNYTGNHCFLYQHTPAVNFIMLYDFIIFQSFSMSF